MKYIFSCCISFILLSSCHHRGDRIGCICNDGTRSYATGSGACSHHGGVDHWLYK